MMRRGYEDDDNDDDDDDDDDGDVLHNSKSVPNQNEREQRRRISRQRLLPKEVSSSSSVAAATTTLPESQHQRQYHQHNYTHFHIGYYVRRFLFLAAFICCVLFPLYSILQTSYDLLHIIDDDIAMSLVSNTTLTKNRNTDYYNNNNNNNNNDFAMMMTMMKNNPAPIVGSAHSVRHDHDIKHQQNEDKEMNNIGSRDTNKQQQQQQQYKKNKNIRYQGKKKNTGGEIFSNHTTTSTNTTATNNTTNLHYFDTIIWPPMQQSMCGKGYPNLFIGRLLFEYARKEVFGTTRSTIMNNSTNTTKTTTTTIIVNNDLSGASFNSKKRNQGNNHLTDDTNFSDTLIKFYTGDFGTTIYEDQQNIHFTTMYVPIWKCANRQIRSMERLLSQHRKGNYIKVGGALVNQKHQHHQLDTMRFIHVKYKNTTGAAAGNKNDASNNSRYLKYIRYINTTTIANITTTIGGNSKQQSTTMQRKIVPVEPCIFTAIRDPIDHFLSGFNEVEFRIHYQKLGNSTIEFPPYHSQIPWYPLNHYHNNNNLTKTSSPGEEYNDRNDYLFQQNNQQRFIGFLHNLLEENTHLSINNEHKHYFSMSMILTPLHAYDYKLTGYIPTITNIIQTYPQFLQQTCWQLQHHQQGQQQLELDLPEFNITDMGIHPSSNDPTGMYKASKDVVFGRSATNTKKKNGKPSTNKYLRALCIIHAIDYACWKDLPKGIPSVCKEVYVRPDFRSMLGVSTKIPPVPPPTTTPAATAKATTTTTTTIQNYPSSISVMNLHDSIKHLWK